MTANEELGTFVRCYWKNGNGTYTDFPEACYNRLAGCVMGTETARHLTMNSVLDLPVLFCVEQVGMIFVSTPEARQASYERDALWEREAEEMRSSWH